LLKGACILIFFEEESDRPKKRKKIGSGFGI